MVGKIKNKKYKILYEALVGAGETRPGSNNPV
jgi:hypothetical protein